MAPLLEPPLFQETEPRQRLQPELTDHGAEMHGCPSWDRTNYFETMTATAENLKFGIDLEADRMVNTRMEKSILDAEMTVVRNEFEIRENNPDPTLMQRAL